MSSSLGLEVCNNANVVLALIDLSTLTNIIYHTFLSRILEMPKAACSDGIVNRLSKTELLMGSLGITFLLFF